jgi:hypothetical protein
MSSLNEKFYDIYMTFKDQKNPLVPIDTIKEYLELEWVSLEDDNEQKEVI